MERGVHVAVAGALGEAQLDSQLGAPVAALARAAALDGGSKTFRKLRGYKAAPKPVAASRAHDAPLDPKCVDSSKEAA